MITRIEKVPTLFLVGGKDELIPPSHMHRLYSLSTAATFQPKLAGKQTDCKHIVVFEHGTHNDTCIQPGYFQAIKSFVEKVL
jgi:pimeloyl-ACP methyl ester carboxylesterase